MRLGGHVRLPEDGIDVDMRVLCCAVCAELLADTAIQTVRDGEQVIPLSLGHGADT